MSSENPAGDKRTCFVVMGFGTKTDYPNGRTLDLDKSYHNLIKPAVEATGLKCIRADEITHSGSIDEKMYQQLMEADLVVADLQQQRLLRTRRTARAQALHDHHHLGQQAPVPFSPLKYVSAN
jgi:hypothetical protein